MENAISETISHTFLCFFQFIMEGLVRPYLQLLHLCYRNFKEHMFPSSKQKRKESQTDGEREGGRKEGRKYT